jgi:hypothetical protein
VPPQFEAERNGRHEAGNLGGAFAAAAQGSTPERHSDEDKLVCDDDGGGDTDLPAIATNITGVIKY